MPRRIRLQARIHRCLLLALLLCAGAVAADGDARAVALDAYLDRGREAGLNFIYASSLVSAAQRIEVTPGQPFSLELLRDALADIGLALEELRPGTFLVKAAVADAPPTPEQPAAPPALEEIVVHSSRYRWSRRGEGAVLFTSDELVRRPALANDVVRVVNQLPGSASVGLSARPRVRGGRENETLIEFDAVRLYSPFHFASYNSLYSVFDERLLGELEFFSGAYPLYMGDSLSASMSIRPPTRDQLEDRREIGVGIYQLSYFQSQLTDDASLLLSLRRSSPESGHLLEAQDLGHPEYGDAYLRYERNTASGRRWSVSALWYGDDLELGGDSGGEEAASNYNSGYAWGRLNSAPGAPLQWTTTLGGGYLENRRAGSVEQPFKVAGTLVEALDLATIFASQDFALADAARTISFGWDYRYIDARHDVASTRYVAPPFAGLSNIDREAGESYAERQQAQQGAVYAGWKRRAGERLYLDVGLRLDAQRYENRDDLELAYRLGVLYQPRPQLELRAAWGRYTQSQALDDLPVADGQYAVLAPQFANQLVLALDWLLPVMDAELRIEAYRKDVDAVNPYFDNLSNAYTLLPELQPDRVRIAPDRYRAQGVELSVEVPVAWGLLWANYAYSSARDRVGGEFVSRSWDQGRTFNGGLLAAFGAWELALSASFHEGWLATDLALQDGRVSAGPRNGARFDHFLSVDAKAVRRWRLGGGELRLEAGVANLTDRDNVIGFDYALDDGAALSATPFLSVSRNLFLDVFWAF